MTQTPILRLNTYEKIRRLGSVGEVQGWRDNLRAGRLGRAPEPDEERELDRREKALREEMTPKQRRRTR